MARTPPTIGAALSILDLAKFRPWLLEGQRDLELQDFCFASVLNGDWKTFCDLAKGMLDGYSGRLGIHGPFSGFEIDTRDPDVREIVVKRMDQGLDVCAELGAVQMVIHSPYKTWDHNNLDLKPRARAAKIEAVHHCLSGAVKRAENQGVTLVIENIQDIDPLDRLRLAQSFDSPAVKLSVDTGHAYYAHGVTGAVAVDQFIRMAGDMLAHVHIQDADGYADRHWQIGAGTICWRSVFDAIAALPAKPHLVLELNDSGQIPASITYLSNLGLGL
ncbi:MAG: sugar phosphate isomerase/epimerase [Alphaproteobacteria bacterium]|nr:sugar phosphate isomerase/epimerase [Alphaproteobacteria bacterium]